MADFTVHGWEMREARTGNRRYYYFVRNGRQHREIFYLKKYARKFLNELNRQLARPQTLDEINAMIRGEAK